MPGFPSKNILERLATSFYYIQMEATCIGWSKVYGVQCIYA
jgi:hypothetical protein